MKITNSKISNEFNFAVVSDIHLGNKRNTSEEIIANLNAEFQNNKQFSTLDLLVLAGDIFDTFLSSLDIIPIIHWMADLLRLCKEHDVALRVLKGTPSHDWEQNVLFEKINNEVSDLQADLQYINKLSITYEERFNMYFLWVPDECHPRAEDTLMEVHNLLIENNIRQVDYAFMHGNFEYQLPDFVNVPKHDSSEYLKIVKHLIFIGHIHTPSNFDRIYAQGSFDRLSHGEEHPKGYYRVTRYKDGAHDVVFIENKNAKSFITIDCSELSLEESIEIIKKRINNLRPRSYVSIRAYEDHPIFSNLGEISKLNPYIFITKSLSKKEQSEEAADLASFEEYTPIEIRNDNIKDLLNERLVKLDLSLEIFNKTQEHIKQMSESLAG